MDKHKYYYNPETCRYERIKKTKKDIFLRSIGFITIVLISSFILLNIYDTYFESPKIVQLKKENQELQTHYEILNKEDMIHNPLSPPQLQKAQFTSNLLYIEIYLYKLYTLAQVWVPVADIGICTKCTIFSYRKLISIT